ncbi:MAG: hypothetical protein PHS80_08680 [Methanothrix sp.]|nr:hypothetical protein [Methanothrix sp.]
MGCFEDYMQFRNDVDEVKKKIHRQRTSDECRCREDRDEKEKRQQAQYQSL